VERTHDTREAAIDGPQSAAGLTQPHHDGSELYVDRLGESAELRLRVPEGAAESVMLRYLKDGEPRMVAATIAVEREGECWWRVELPLRNPLVSYRWLLTGGELGYRWVNGTGAYPHEVSPNDDFKLLTDPGSPDWDLASVGYEIFIDRFASSGAAQTLPDWAVPREWDDLPESPSPNTNKEIFGGDLGGIEQHLDHIDGLGAGTIYLTPFFPAPSNHRYDPSAFDRVDPLVGGEGAFESLVRATREKGLRLVGDLSLDHCGAGHEWFLRACADETSAERGFFLFDRTETHGYVSWLGTGTLPRFDWRSEELRRRMSDALQRWLDLGLDGWRIGAATMVGRHGDVDINAEMARWTRRQAGDALLVGEYWNDFRPDVDGQGWHGVMNYAGFLRPVWWWLRSDRVARNAIDVFTAAPAPSYGGRQAATVMQSFRAGMPWEVALHSWLLLDTHDTPRFRTVTDSRERHLVGVGLQMTTPGMPLVFAGDEIGLEGASGHDARRTMPWGRPDVWDHELLGAYRRLIALRRSRDALARGGLRYVHIDDDAILYLRETKAERLLCLAARAPHRPIAVPFQGLTTLYGDDASDGVLPSHGPAFHVWRIDGA
jgi:alpha-glucosidase